MAMSLPRMRRIASSSRRDEVARLAVLAAEAACEPAAIAPTLRASRRMTDRLVTDLPEPDSPTSATVSPGADDRSRSLTAVIAPPRMRKTVRRPLMSRMGSVPVAMAFISGESPTERRMASTPRGLVVVERLRAAGP